MKTPEIKWGLITGAAYAVWLHGCYFLGLHTGSLGSVQIAMLIGYLIVVFGIVTGLRAVNIREPDTSFVEGIKAGLLESGIVLAIAILAWLLYLFVINPGYGDFWVGQAEKYYSQYNLKPEELEAELEVVRRSFSLQGILLGAVVGIPLVGGIISLIFMAFIKRVQKR